MQSLTLENFQAHKHLTIALDPHVTTIVGNSDVGKTAIIRALRWLCQNKPNGNAFIRHGTTLTTVTAKVGGHTITRTRSIGSNAYALDRKNFTAFGNDVPADVAKILNVADINFQGQHDAPFWFGETAGEVSRQLNEIVNLGAIDTTLAKLNAGIRTTTAEITVLEDRVDKARAESRRLRVAHQMQAKLQEAYQFSRKSDELCATATLLGGLLQGVAQHRVQAKNAAAFVLCAGKAIAAGERWQEKAGEREKLTALLTTAKQTVVVARRRVPSTDKLEALHERGGELTERLQGLASLLEQAEKAKMTLKTAAANAEADAEAFTKLMGKTCPLCGQKVTNEKEDDQEERTHRHPVR